MNWKVLAVLCGFCAAVPASAAAVVVSVEQRGGGLYEITGRFAAAASSATAWSVLSDYANIPSFVPSMESSRVLRRGPSEATVEQVSIWRALIFRRELRVMLRIEESPAREIRFEDVGRRSFRVYRGEWMIAPAAGGSEITYRLVASSAFAAPGFIARGAARRMVAELLEDVRREMERRAGAPRS